MKSLADVEPFGVNGEDIDGRLNLKLSSALSEWSVLDATGQKVAVLYGRILKAWCGPGIHISDTIIRTDFAVTSVDIFEKLIGLVHGSFVAETQAPLPHRLYPDAGGTIPIVYCTVSKRVSSSAGMMLDDAEYFDRFLTKRYRELIEKEIAGAWIPGFLTGHKDIYRMLPNFYLDLQTWTTHRFWPKPEDLDEDIPLEEAAVIIAENLRGYVNAVAAQFPLISPTMTAGFDTRIVLASCRDVALEQIECLTMGKKDQGLDQTMAVAITEALGLKHRLVPVLEASNAETELWDRMVGHCTREVTRKTHPTLWQVQADVMFTGMYGETGRSRLYVKELDAVNNLVPDARFIAGRAGVPLNNTETLETLDQWLETIHWAPTSKILDLTFNELKFGGWAMAQAPVQRAIQFSLMPLAQRDIQRVFMNVRPSVKTDSQLFSRVCEILWPETLEYSINKYDDYRDKLKFLNKFLHRHHLTRAWRLAMTRLGK